MLIHEPNNYLVNFIGKMKAMIQALVPCLILALATITTTQFASSPAQQPLIYNQPIIQSWLNKSLAHITKTNFENGATLITYTMPDTCKVSLQVVLDVGSKDESPGELGFAHVIEHMLFKGTSTLSEQDIIAIAAKFGAGKIGEGFNAFTSCDTTSYLFDTDSVNWPIFLQILLDCVQNASFDEAHLESELHAIINELKIGETSAGRCLYHALNRTVLHEDHPYHIPTIGTRKVLLQTSRDALVKFYKQHYIPKNVTIIVAGDITHDAVSTLAATLMATQPCANTLEKKPTHQFPYTESRTLNKTHAIFYKDTPHHHISYVWHNTPQLTSTEFAAASCITEILNKRLNHYLVDDLNAAHAVSACYYPLQLMGSLRINLIPQKKSSSTLLSMLGLSPSTNRARCYKAIVTTLADLIANGPTDAELIEYKNNTTLEILDFFSKPAALSSVLASVYNPTHDEYFLATTLEATHNLTKGALQRFCTTYLDNTYRHTFECKPLREKDKEPWLQQQTTLDALDTQRLNTRIRKTLVAPTNYLNQLPQPQPLPWPILQPTTKFTLNNGLNVYLLQDTRTPFIHMRCSFKNNEPFSMALAINKQLLHKNAAMELLNEGSQDQTKQELAAFFANQGGSYSFTKQGGSLSCLAHTFSACAATFFEILTNPLYGNQSFKNYYTNTLNQIELNQKNPDYLASKALTHYLFSAYPWILSQEEETHLARSLTRDDVFFFHTTYIAPHTMNLVITGNFDESKLRKEIEAIFGSWKNQKAFPIETIKVTIPDLANPPTTTLKKFWPKEQLITLIAARVGCLQDSNDDLALDLLDMHVNKLLFGIREATGLFYSINARSNNAYRAARGSLTIHTQITPDNLEQAQIKIYTVLQSIAAHGIDQESLDTARYNISAVIAKSLASSESLCSLYSDLLASNKPWDFYTTYRNRLMAMSCEQVNACAARYYNPETWSFSIIGRIDE